jgi:hypothetical protein
MYQSTFLTTEKKWSAQLPACLTCKPDKTGEALLYLFESDNAYMLGLNRFELDQAGIFLVTMDQHSRR